MKIIDKNEFMKLTDDEKWKAYTELLHEISNTNFEKAMQAEIEACEENAKTIK